jgi:hypothetical protein
MKKTVGCFLIFFDDVFSPTFDLRIMVGSLDFIMNLENVVIRRGVDRPAGPRERAPYRLPFYL